MQTNSFLNKRTVLRFATQADILASEADTRIGDLFIENRQEALQAVELKTLRSHFASSARAARQLLQHRELRYRLQKHRRKKSQLER